MLEEQLYDCHERDGRDGILIYTALRQMWPTRRPIKKAYMQKLGHLLTGLLRGILVMRN